MTFLRYIGCPMILGGDIHKKVLKRVSKFIYQNLAFRYWDRYREVSVPMPKDRGIDHVSMRHCGPFLWPRGLIRWHRWMMMVLMKQLNRSYEIKAKIMMQPNLPYKNTPKSAPIRSPESSWIKAQNWVQRRSELRPNYAHKYDVKGPQNRAKTGPLKLVQNMA